MIELLERVPTGKVVIMRGLPGSGKTKYATSLYLKPNWREEPAYCSADSFFFYNDEGEYKFDISLIGEAHNRCQRDFVQALKDKQKLIIVDNTASRRWEYILFIELAEAFNYDVEVVEIACPDRKTLQTFIDRQQHGVPRSAVLEMWYRWEEHSPGMGSHVTHKIVEPTHSC